MATSLKEVYDAFKADGAPLPDTYEKFEKYMTSGPNNGYDHRKQWYDAFKADGAPLPDTYEQFSKALFKPADNDTEGQPWNPSPMQRAKAIADAGKAVNDFHAQSQGAIEAVRRNIERTTPEGRSRMLAAELRARQAGLPTKPLGFTPKAAQEAETDSGREDSKTVPAVNVTSPTPYDIVTENGEKKVQYLLPDGTVSTDFLRADVAEYNARQARRSNMTLTSRLRDAIMEQQHLDALMSQRRAEIDAENKKSPLSSFLRGIADESHGMPGGIINDNGMRDYRMDEQYRQLESAARKNRQTIQILSDKKNGQMNSFWHNLGTTLTDGYTLSDGLSEMNDALALIHATKRIDDINRKRKTGKELTQEEKTAEKVLHDNAIYFEAQSEYGGEYGAWARAGSMFATSLDLMKDIMLTPSAGTIAKGVASGVSKGFSKGIAKVAGDKVAESIAARVMTKATGILIGAHTAGAVVSNTAGIGHTLGEMSEVAAGNVANGEDGYEVVNQKGLLEALYDAERNQIRENGSEMFGEFIPGIGGLVMKGLEKIGLKKVAGHLTDIGRKEWYQQYKGLLKSGGYNGLPGEGIEEYEGYLFDALTGHGADAANELGDLNTHIDIWLGCATTGALLGSVPMVIHGAHTAMYYKYRHATGKSDKTAYVVLGNRWNDLRERIDATPNEKMADVLTDIVSNGGMMQRENTAILDYARNLSKMRGYNLAQMAVTDEGGKDDELTAAVNNSYRDGYEASSPQEMNDAQNMYEFHRQRAEGMFERDMLDWFDGDPVNALMNMSRNGIFSQEEIDAARDYINAKTVRDGILQRVNDNIDEQIAQSDAMINGRVNQASGMIQPAIIGLDDRQVYIVSGAVAVNEDGTIDRDASDESIVVRDAQTGELEFTDPKSIVSAGEAIDPETEKAIAVDNIRQQAAQAAADAMNGALAFNPGDVVQINDGGGVVQVSVVGPVVDEESGMPIEGQIVVQFPNGQQAAFAKEQLQAFADAANLERLNEFEQGRATERAQQHATEAEAMRPQFALNDEFTIVDNDGARIYGEVVRRPDMLNDNIVWVDYYRNADHKVRGDMPFRTDALPSAELLEQIESYNGRPLTAVVPENVEPGPKTEETPEIEGENSENSTETVPDTTEPAIESQQSALSRIPVDEQGQPKYDDVDPDTAWDAIVEQTQGDEATAAEVVSDIVAERQEDFNAAEKALAKTKEGKPEKRKKGDPAPTMAERIAAKNAAKATLAEAQAIRDRAKAALDHWTKIAGTKQRRESERRAAEDAEARRRAHERAAEEARLKAEREEAGRKEREALNGVPDWNVDTPADARARGYRRNGSLKVDRPEIIDNHALGNAVEVKFGENMMPIGNIAIIEASQLQPSHRDGQRNPAHFLDEAQPKERKDAASRFAADKIAETMRPEEITSSVTAFTGAPSINSRGEVIQGNNRSEALRLMYEKYSQSAEKYKQYLLDHAAEFGLTPEAIAAFEQPVLVNMLDVSDADAITLGQYVAQDTESGGVERIKPKNAVQKMGDKIRTFANLLLRSADEEATFAQLVDANGTNVLKWMNRQGFITNTQYASAFDSKGNLSAEAANDLKGIMYQSIFTGGSTRLEEMFNNLPSKAQRAILATAFRDYDSPFTDRMIDEVQQSIIAFNALMGYEQFRDATNAEATMLAIESWKKQSAFDDVTGEPYLPSEVFSNFALALAAMYKGNTQKHIQSVFNMMYDIVQGTEQDNLFESADKTPKPLAEAIRRVLNIEYQPITKTDNGTNGSAVLDIDSQDGQDGRPGSGRDADGAEQSQEETEPSDSGTGAASDSRQGSDVNIIDPREMSDEERARRGDMLRDAEAVNVGTGVITAKEGKSARKVAEEWWDKNVGEPIFFDTEAGEVEIDKTSIKDSLSHGYRQEKLDAVASLAEGFSNAIYLGSMADFNRPGVTSHYFAYPINYDGQRRYVFCRAMADNNKNRLYVHEVFMADSIKESDTLQTIASASKDGELHGGIALYKAILKNVLDLSADKDSALSVDKQEDSAESSLGERVKAAEAEVNTTPTDAQKEAGNYKKGHVQVGTFDVTIEQPVGSVRRGKDADGKAWETTMQNTYGYIRGTEGVDGDHIDVFLSTDIDAWNGRRVVVVDQYNPDGTFDEHKVMLGFNDKADAINAYLANYEKGWEKGRRLVFSTATLEDFEKWIESSHRKQKPYHEYKIAEKAEVDESTPENPISATDYTIDTYATKKNKTYLRVIFPRADKEVWQKRLNLAKKMGGTSVPKGYGFKTREEAEAFAKAVADPTAVADAQPLSLEDIRGSIIEEPTTTSSTEAEQSSETETQPEVDNPVNPSGNKLVTDERYAELRERMRKKLGGQLNMGVDPEILAIGTEMAVYHIEKGARKFKAYASAMIADLGDAIRPYLKSFYNAVRDMPEAEAAGLIADMDSYDEVRSVDIANFDKPGTNAMATAATVVAEQEAEKEKEEAERKLKEKRKKRTNPDGSTTETVVESGTEIEITSGDFIPGVHPIVDAQKPSGKKKPSKEKPKSTTDGGLFDTVEDDTTTAPAITVPEQRPTADLMGDSAAFQEREAQTVELVEEIGGVIESRVAMLQLDAESVKPLNMTDIKKMASKYPALKGISDTDLQELVELAMTQLTRSEALVNIDGTAEAQRAAYDYIVNLYQIQPSLNARDSERLIKQQYSTPTPFGYVMGQFVRAGGKTVGSMLEPSAGNGALTITVHPSVIHVNDIDDARLANLRKLGYGQVTAQDALLPFDGDKVDVVMTNPPFGTVTEKVYDGVFRISSLEGQMAINALEQMKDDGRAAIVIGGNTSYRTNGSMNPKDAAFFGYLYSHYNVADVINISGKALYSRNGTGYDVRMILIDGRKTGEFQRVFPPVKAKARAEQVTTFDELYKRVQDDIQQIQQVGSQSADVQREPEAATDGTASAPVRTGSNRPNTGAGQRPSTTSDAVRDTPRTVSGQPATVDDGSSPAGVDNADSGNAGSTDNVPQPNPQQPRSVGGGSAQDGTGRSGSDGRGTVAPRPDSRAERLEVKPDLTTEKVPYPNQSENGFTLMSVVPAAQAQVLQKSLAEIGDVDQFLVDELGYSSKEELYGYLAAEQVDSVALAIHQMNKGNAFIIGDMTGVGKGRQGAALIRYAVKQGKVPIYFTQKPTLFTDNYRDLSDIGSRDLRPFIIASNPKDANIVDTDGNVVHKLPSKKEQERVFNYIMEHGTLPEEYDYVLTTYDQIKNGTADYTQNEDGTWNTEARKLPKKSKGYTTADYNGQARRDALAQLAEGNIAILDESHTVGGDSGCGRYMQMLTSSAEGVTFLSATFAKRADNMPIYAQRTAIAEAGVKASELIEAISKGGVTLQEIMSKQLVESGQMIRRERSFEGVTIDWLSVEEETDRRQRQQFNEVADIFNAIRNFQDDYITPIIDAKNEAAAEHGATVGHTQGTKDLGVKNVPFASKMYNLVNQLLFALKVDAVADRVVENLRNGYKPVISFTNTMEGFLSSAPKGVVMDDVPNFSLTLMRALDGVMRFTEKDADENSEGGSISLSELSAEGQKAYNAIRDKIINLSADLPISPMDAIRMKIEEAGYSVAEITGRTMQLNRTDDGRYIVEARKDRDKKAAMRDFNSGKLDVLMINKSGSTGISLHASSKFEDQRPRVMVFAQFQSDINDEVQMRGRIDRSGQVTRGRYEYIMSTIPAEQRIQMMFKAKLKSLDANTTSSQKSKFNEMEIVDYLNKYGDDVVWEYMKEHPELEERLGDPLSMLQEKQEEDGPRTSEKEDTSKKTGCAGKISRYLAFLSVDEQDEIFREITEAYRVKIQLLDDAGENDLEITTMPLRAETKRKQIWHEGENPGSGNAFADNTYVEEVEVDVLKKPMKRAEIAEATRKLMGEHYTEKNGGVDWQHYARAKGDEISLFFQAKADEAVGKLKEAGEARIAKARERAVTAATKARGRGENNFTDEEIQSLADTVANEERNKEEQKQRKRQEEIMAIKHRLQSLLQRLRAGSIYVVPQDLKQGTAEMFSQTFGTFVGFKFNKGYTLGSSTAIFATLDGRRKVELALSDPAISTIISATEIAYRYSPKEINAITMENWDSKVPTQTRQKRYIITGNLLQALVDTEKGEKTRGNLISYSTIDGETRQGILMGENFKLTDLRNSASLSSRLAQIREGKAVVSENGDVQIEKVSFGWQHRGQYELRVPKSKQRGGIYTMHSNLLKLVEGHNFITKGNNMVAYVDDTDIAKVVDMLSRAPFNLTVLQESQLTDVSADEAEDDVLCRPVTDKATLDRLNSEPTIKVYRAMQMIDGGLRPPMSGKVDGQWREATEVGVWEEAEEHPEMADENCRFKLDKGNGKSIKAAYNPYIHTSRSPINDQFSSAWSRSELVTVEVEIPESELTSGYHAEKAKNSVGEMEWKSGPVSRALAKIGQARRVILSRWSRIIRVVPVEEVAEAYAQRLNAHGIEVPFNTVPPSLRDALAERGVKIGKPEKGNAGKASMPAFEQWIMEQERLRQGDGYGAYSDAEVSYLNDPVSKVMGKNRFSKKRQAEFAARERQSMVTRIQELAERMHLDNVEILTDASQLEGKRAKAKGFYNKRTGKITIVIPNNVSTIDAEQTLLHEAVAHFGLRKLFGEQFNTFLDNVYQSANESIRRKITEMAAKNGWDFRTATEEYLAGLAEDTNFDEARAYGGLWSKIKSLFLDMLEKIGFEGFRNKVGVVLTDNELRYILWRSYQNLAEPGRYRSILGEAADVAKQSQLKVGNYAPTAADVAMASESTTTELFNDIFNEQLDGYISGKLSSQEYLNVGMPQGIIRNFLPELPIVMRQRILSKASETKHNVALASLRDLPSRIAKPIFIFQRNTQTIGVLTEIKDRDGKNVCVAIELSRTIQKGGEVLEVNDVRSIHGRDAENIVLPIVHNNTLRYADKKKGLAWLSSASSNYQQEIASQDLETAAKIVKEFENPTIEYENNLLFRSSGSARDEYDERVRTKIVDKKGLKSKGTNRAAQLNEAYLDGMRSLRVLQEAVSHETGKPVQDFENAYMAENQMSSRNKIQEEAFQRDHFEPMCKAVADVCKGKNEAYRELLDYIIAKHGLERNAYMRAKAVADGMEQGVADATDFSGLTALTGEANVTDAEAKAEQMVSDYETSHDTAELWNRINAATAETLRIRYQGGLLSKDVYEQIRGMYNNYIPLKGWDETTAIDVYEYASGGYGLSSALMAAHGRRSLADDPLSTIMTDAQRTIMEANRNIMKQKFLNLALNHQTDLLSISRQWYIKQPDGTWLPDNPVIPEDADADTVDAIVKAHEAQMLTLEAQGDAKSKRSGLKLGVVKGNADTGQHVVKVKRNGETYCIYVNGDPRAARAINGMLNPDAGEKSRAAKVAQEVKNFMAKAFTTWNPEFIVGNLARDVMFAGTAVAVKEDGRYVRRYTGNITVILAKAKLPHLLYKWEHGTLDDSIEEERYFKEFLMNGGETGYTQLNTVEQAKKDMARFLREARGGASSVSKKAWRGFWRGVEFMNRSAEDTTRFAVYMTSRQQGRSVSRSISDAKEITVNFNRKGSGAWGARYMNFLYVFFNACMQSAANMGRLVSRHKGKAAIAAGVFLSAGFLVPMLSCIIGALTGDGDDDDEYWKLSEWERRNNICLRIPFTKRHLMIPIAHELRPIYGIGEIAYSIMCGKETIEDGIWKGIEGFGGMLPVDPTGNGGNNVVTFSPTIAQPLVQIHENVNYFGKPIYRDTPWNKDDPEWTKAYKGTNGLLVDLSRMLSEAGSTTDEYGVVSYPKHWYTGDINPAIVEHLLESYTGGLGKTVNGFGKTISMLWNEDARTLRNVPVARKLLSQSDERAETYKFNNDYFKIKEEYDESKKYLRKLGTLDNDSIIGVADRVTRWLDSEKGQRYEMMNDYFKELNSYSRAINNEEDEQTLSEMQHDVDSIKRELVQKVDSIKSSQVRK